MGNCQDSEMLNNAYEPNRQEMGPVGELKVVSLSCDSNYMNLFDYEASNLKKSQVSCSFDSYLISKQRKFHFEDSQYDLPPEILKDALLRVEKKDNFFRVLTSFQEETVMLERLPWLVVKTVPDKHYPLKVKDIIRFGKQKAKVREIVLKDANGLSNSDVMRIQTTRKIYEDLQLKKVSANSIMENISQKKEDDVISIATENELCCKVCLEPGEFDNPLICPCKCTGSVKYIHLVCLRTWLGKRLNVVRGKNCITIKWKTLSCEMCQAHYKYRIFLDGKKYYTVEIPKPQKPYIVLEMMKKSVEFSKLFIFVSLANTGSVSVGRRKDVDIRIAEDISISRHHANIIFDQPTKQFFLFDNKSKFGTMVLVSKSLRINPRQRGISVQMGSEVFTFEAVRKEVQETNPTSFNFKEQTHYLNAQEEGPQEEEDESEEDEEDDFEEPSQQFQQNRNEEPQTGRLIVMHNQEQL